MAGIYRRLLDARAMSGSEVCERQDVLDLGAYRTLQLHVRVLKAGTGGSLKIQHTAQLQPEAWLDLGLPIALIATSDALTTETDFLRFVRWITSNAAGSPVAVVDVVAKD